MPVVQGIIGGDGHFGPLVVGLMLLTQPAVAVLIGWLAFNERLGPPDALGMLLVAGSLVLARVAGRDQASAEASVG